MRSFSGSLLLAVGVISVDAFHEESGKGTDHVAVVLFQAEHAVNFFLPPPQLSVVTTVERASSIM